MDDAKARGKALRKELSRKDLGAWNVRPERPEVLDILCEQERGRLEDLLPLRHERMAASPFAFYRGAAAIMAADLATQPTTGLRAQLCGDAHIANFGGFRSPESHLVFDINDFDETLPGPWEWDVKRLMASIQVCGEQRGFTQEWCAETVRGAARSYREGMREFAAQSALEVWRRYIDVADTLQQMREQASGADKKRIAAQIERAYGKDSSAAFKKLVDTSGDAPKMAFDPPAIVPLDRYFPDDEAQRLLRALETVLASYRTSLPDQYVPLFDQYRFLDGAMKVVGVGSVGMRAWVAAFTDELTGEPLVLQMKQACDSVLAPYCGQSAFDNQGQRVVNGQRLMQTASDRFLGWARAEVGPAETRDYYVRQLWNWKMTIDYEKASASLMEGITRLCGWTLARAHARTGDRGAIAGYLGSSAAFDDAMAEFAHAYAQQNEADYRVFLEARTKEA